MAVNIEKQLADFNKRIGFKVTIEAPDTRSSEGLAAVENRHVQVAFARIMDHRIIVIAYDSSNMVRLRKVMQRLSNEFNLISVALITQLSAQERKQLLAWRLSFITLDGDVFLPFMGTRLMAAPVAPATDAIMTPIAQRLILLILDAQLLYERQGQSALNTHFAQMFQVESGLFKITGGQRFVTGVGQRFEINNRVAFTRATKPLIELGLLKGHGETKNRVYTCELTSRKLFNQLKHKLISPISKRQSKRLSYAELKKLSHNDFLTGGLTALAKLTMINDDAIKTIVLDRQAWQQVTESQIVTDEADCQAEVSQYRLNPFADLFRMIVPDYPESVIDPFHLYAIFANHPDERVAGEVVELVDKIWESVA